MKGKLFWLRSLGASIVGEFVFVVISLLIEYLNVVPFGTILQLIFISFILKIMINPILIIPSSILTMIIKKIEKVDLYEYDLEFNPLKMKFSKSLNDKITIG